MSPAVFVHKSLSSEAISVPRACTYTRSLTTVLIRVWHAAYGLLGLMQMCSLKYVAETNLGRCIQLRGTILHPHKTTLRGVLKITSQSCMLLIKLFCTWCGSLYRSRYCSCCLSPIVMWLQTFVGTCSGVGMRMPGRTVHSLFRGHNPERYISAGTETLVRLTA